MSNKKIIPARRCSWDYKTIKLLWYGYEAHDKTINVYIFYLIV